MTSISNNKQIAKNTVFLYFRMFLTMGVSLYTVRVVLRTLSVVDYGIYGAVGGIILSFGFISGVLTNASQRFFSVELGKGANGRVKETFSTLFMTYLFVSLLIVLIAETLGLWFLQNKMTIPPGREDAALWVFQFALLSFIVTLLANPFQALIISYERMNLYAYLSILDVVLKLLIVYVLILFDFDKLKLYAVLIFVSQTITNTIYVVYCRNKYKKDVSTSLHFDRKLFRSVFSYSSWTLFGTLAGMCNTQGVNIVLNMFFGPIANAAYSIASQIYHTVSMFATNFYTAVKPPLIKNYASGNYDYVQKLFAFSSKAIFILLFIIVLPLLVCTEEILELWLGNVGAYMVVFVQLSLIYTIILTISYPITAVVQAGGNVKLYHGLVDGFSLLALPIVYALFKLGFDAQWAYITTIVVFAIAHLLRMYVLKKVFPQFVVRKYLIHFVFPSLMIACLLYFVMVQVKTMFTDSVMNTLVVCTISVIVALASCVLFLLTKEERQMIIKMIRK